MRDFRPYQLSFLLKVLARLEMRDTRDLGAGILTNAYLTFKDASFSPPPNLHTCISLVEVYRFGQCLGERFSPLSTFFSVVSSRAFRDSPHSCFRCGDLNQCLLNFLKMLLLAFLQIYTRVFHLWKSVALDNTWVKDSRPFIFFHSRVFARLAMRHTRVFLCGDPKVCLRGSLKMLVLALLQIYTSVFHLLKSIDLDSAWVRYSFPCQFSFLPRILAR